MCPVMSKFFLSPLQDSFIAVLVGNENPNAIEVTCILRVFDDQSEALQSYSQTLMAQSDEPAEFSWELVDQAIVLPSVACNLPPNGLIQGIVSGFVAS